MVTRKRTEDSLSCSLAVAIKVEKELDETLRVARHPSEEANDLELVVVVRVWGLDDPHEDLAYEDFDLGLEIVFEKFLHALVKAEGEVDDLLVR